MNETINILSKRKSLRRYAQQPVCRDHKDMIIQAAMRAPAAGNMMLYSMLEVDDQNLKNRLVETCDHQPFIA